MERRDFLRKSAIVAATAAVAPQAFAKSEMYTLDPQAAGGDFTIVSDKTEGTIRTLVVTPSPKVCSKQIDIQIDMKTKTIKSCSFTRGCPGNALGLCKLLTGMSVAKAIKDLKGIPCSNRGTSCPDQFARVLESLHI